ncbi:tyrosine-type recombinase/integrase [Thermotoga profunda]|uniref:tyrosine-type recombinase/integrase n=1 Tax=Thermotoga profunda TaxID=1508420 RepID=UPI0005970310|nr:tyrosine-type recombinase/integrase [Thermotoga profunda]
MDKSDLFERFETILRTQKLSSLTVTAYLSVIKKLLQDIDVIDEESILSWARKVADGHKPATVNLYYSAIRRFLEETHPHLLLKLKDKLRIKGRSFSIPKALSEQEFSKLWKVATRMFDKDYRLVLIVGLGGFAGLRVSELISLKVSHINLKEDYILINGKGRKMRVVPVPSKLKSYIFRIISCLSEDDYLLKNNTGKPLSIHGVAYLLKQLAKKAHIKNISPHTLRHTAATVLLKKGVNLRIVQEFLGHASLATTERYLRVTINDMKESLKKAGY